MQVARSLLERCADVIVVLTGGPEEAASAQRLLARIDSPRAISLAGQTTFIELIELYRIASLLITNDSGPVHFASMTDLATLALYGPETPRIFGPTGNKQRALWLGLACSPCISVHNQKRTLCRENICMSGIKVETVLSEALALLGEQGPHDHPTSQTRGA